MQNRSSREFAYGDRFAADCILSQVSNSQGELKLVLGLVQRIHVAARRLYDFAFLDVFALDGSFQALQVKLRATALARTSTAQKWVTLRMPAPVSSWRAAMWRQSMSSATAICGGKVLRQISLAFLGARHREVDDGLEAAHEGVVDVGALVGGEDDQARCSSRSAAAGRRLPGWRICRGRRGCRCACRTGRRLRRRTGSSPCARPCRTGCERFFSVSPMYLETTRDRSMRKTSAPVCLPSSVAVSVLPVPGGP